MKKVWFVGWLLVLLGSNLAAHGAIPVDEDSVAAARAQIDTQREAENALFAAQDDNCLARFTITVCQNEVAKRHRAALAQLKRQEVELNNAVRRHRTREQLERTQKKLDARTETEVPSDAVTSADREMALEEKQRNRPQPALSAPRKPKTMEPVNAQVLEARRQAYAEKQQEQARKRQERDKRLQEQGPPKASLPIPP